MVEFGYSENTVEHHQAATGLHGYKGIASSLEPTQVLRFVQLRAKR